MHLVIDMINNSAYIYIFRYSLYLYRKKVNIKEAIYYVAESWDEVEESTIVNCWKKTGILPLLLDNKIDDSSFAAQDVIDLENDDVGELIIDLTMNLSDSTIEHQINEFNRM